MNPLHCAAKDGNAIVVNELIRSGENVNDVDKVYINYSVVNTQPHTF